MERELREHQELETQHDEESAKLRQAKQESDNEVAVLRAVSYTHLTLPTKRIV